MKPRYVAVCTFISFLFFIFIIMTRDLMANYVPKTCSDSLSKLPASGKYKVPVRGFISSEPAETWEQGLITGNGTIGANVLSRPLNETIIFTHERLFLPQGPPYMPPPDTGIRLFEIRRLIERGLYRQAQQLAFDLSRQSGFMYPDPFVPAFDLNIQMESSGEITNYMRSVDFQTGEASVYWTDNTGDFQRRLFVSRADGLAVLLITGPGKGAISCKLKLKPREPSKKLDPRQLEASAKRFESHVAEIKITADKNTLTWENSFTKAYPGSLHRLEGVVYVIAENGMINAEGETLTVTGADQVLAFIDLDVIYDPQQSKINEMINYMAGLPADYNILLKRHVEIHGELFNRVRLDLGGGEDHNLTTEELLARSTDENLNKALIEKEFDAGRYNIICSIGELPPTLQGKWAGTYSPPWASDFTHNGNLPSAISSLLMGNTPELMLAYTSYIESLVPYMEINAKHMFGARGVVLPSRSTTHGFNNALNANFPGGFWVAGAAWAAHFFYDYYLYTGDRDFLAKHALPFMEKVAMFFEDYLYEGPDGKYIFSPTQSPENSPANTKVQASFNATMDVAAAKELFTNIIAASQELGVNQERIPVWRRMLEKMPDYMIDEKLGVVKEWITPKLEEQLNHRHSSQLYALFDGLPEEIARNPRLRNAFKRIIEIKLEQHWKKGSGFMSFGLVQLGLAAASLGEGELAYQCLTQLVNRYWLNNLASMHNHKSLFNMDISGGMPAVIIKMLVASEPGKIRVLPALPAAWPSGSIEGVLCRGQIQIKRLEWNEDRIQINLVSAKNQTITLETSTEIKNFSVKKGKVSVKKTDKNNSRQISLPAQQEIILEIKTG